jgi:hypothetical protein
MADYAPVVSSRSPNDESARDVFRYAEDLVGEDRFGGAWIEHDGGIRQLGIAIVSPLQHEVTSIQEAARGAGWSLTIDVARYSRNELIGFYDGVVGPEGDSLVSFGWEARANKVAVMLSNVDPDAMAYFRERVPDDALLIRLVSYRAVAADGDR